MMGQQKRLLDEAEDAIEAGVRAGALSRCETCEEVTDAGEMEETWQDEARALFAAEDESVAAFDDEKHLIKAIESAIADAGDECACERGMSADD